MRAHWGLQHSKSPLYLHISLVIYKARQNIASCLKHAQLSSFYRWGHKVHLDVKEYVQNEKTVQGLV